MMNIPFLTVPVICLLVYFVVILLVARFFARKVDTLKDFFLAGRSLGSWPVALSYAAAWFGAGSTMGSINAFHDRGLSGAWDIVIPSALSFLLITFFMAKPVARQSYLSQPEAVKSHYGNAGRLLLTLIILACTTATLGSQMVAAGKVFQGVFGLDIFWATVISTAIVVNYAMWGGFFTVVVTDIVQIFFVVIGFVVLLLFTAHAALPGPDSWHHFISRQPAQFWNIGYHLQSNVCLALVFGIAWGIAPEMWQRMSSTKNPELAFRAGWQTILIVTVLYALVIAIGLFSTRVVGQSDAVLVVLAKQIPNQALSMLVLLGFIAAVTSTMDTLMNVGSLTLTKDLYQGFLRPKAGERELLWTSRIATVLIVIPAAAIALYYQDIIKILWISADIYASSMFFPIMGLLYLKNPGRWSGILGMAFGGVTVAFSALIQNHLLPNPMHWPAAPYSTLIGIAASGIGFGTGYLLSHRPAPTVEPEEDDELELLPEAAQA